MSTISPKAIETAEAKCPVCNGNGSVVNPFDPSDGRRCPNCKGFGRVMNTPESQLPTATLPSQEVEEPKNHGKWEVHPVEIQFECSHGIWAEGNHSSICYCTNATLAEWIKNQLCLAASQQKEREEMKSELVICRVALGIPEDRIVPLDQTPKHGSILVERGGMRSRISPIDDDVKQLELELELQATEATASRQAGVIGELRKALEDMCETVECYEMVHYKMDPSDEQSGTKKARKALGGCGDVT